MVSTPEGFTDKSVMSPNQSVTVKHISARKPLRLFLEALDVKPRTDVHKLCAAKSNRKEIRAGSMFWSCIPKRRGHTKINERFKKALYSWILQHPQVFQSAIANYFLKISIGGQAES